MVLSFTLDGIPKRRECFRMASEAKKKKKSGNEFHPKKTFLGKKNPFSFPREVIFLFSFPREVFFLTFFRCVLLEMGGNGRGMCF